MAETKKKNGRMTSKTLPIGYVLRGGKYDYRVEEVLGQGSYGITYKVSAQIYVGNIPVRQFFAIKENFVEKYCSRKSDGVTVTFPGDCEEEARRDINDFLAEGKRLEQLCKGHKNIVNVNETFYANNTAYYTMEYINGGDLCKIVKRNGRLSEYEALNIIAPIIDAVGYVHEQHVMHYDIKPENIMIRKGENGEPDEPVLIDFGIALHYDINGNLTKTSKDRGVGCSDGYAPMEQYAGDFKFSPESDVYALSATLFYMLSGKVPQKSFDITPDWIARNLPNEVKDQTRSAIIHSMAKLKDNRTKTAEAFAKDLGLSVTSQKQTADSNKTYKYKKEQYRPKVDPQNDDSIKYKEEQTEQINIWEGLDLWERFKEARNRRGWKSSSLLYLGFVVSFLASLLSAYVFYQNIMYGLKIEYIILLLLMPLSFFIFIALLCSKKWGFWGLLAIFFAYLIDIVNISSWSFGISETVIFVVVPLVYFIALYYSFSSDGSWSNMDNKITDKHSVWILLGCAALCLCVVIYGNSSRSKYQQEEANLYHEEFTQAVQKCEDMVKNYESAKTLEAKIDDLVIAKEAYSRVEQYEKRFGDIQPNFYSKAGGLKYPLHTYLSETTSDYSKKIDVNKITDYPRTISVLQIAKELSPDDESLYNLYQTVIAESAYMKIKDVQFNNRNDSTIDDYGATLYSNKMRYLGAKILYDGLIDETTHPAVDIKIISPNGRIEQGSGSPKGYSFKDTLTVIRGNDIDCFLLGWGNESESIYERGVWKYEIWYNGKKIYSTKVNIK